MYAEKDDTRVGLFGQRRARRVKEPPERSDPARKSNRSLRANPSRGGDAKPGISRRPPGCRSPNSPVSDRDKEVPEMPYVIRPPRLRAAIAACAAMLLVGAVPAQAE